MRERENPKKRTLLNIYNIFICLAEIMVKMDFAQFTSLHWDTNIIALRTTLHGFIML